MRLGSYEVEDEIGSGGMGVVYRARGADGTLVAIKVLTRSDAARAARFDRERRLQAALGREEGFLPLIDAGTGPRGPYVVMPFAGGGTLRDRLRTEGRLPTDATVALGQRLAAAMGRAHALGIVHRDLKPENVLFAEHGEPLVADLGLAKHFERDGPATSQSVSLTRTGALLGTAGYIAPEQLADAKTAGPPADVFALGAILYECLAGKPAFAGESVPEVLTRLHEGSFEPLAKASPGTPAWLASAVERALAREPGERFADGAALARALAAAAAPGGPGKRSRRGLAVVAGATVLSLAAGAALLARFASGPRASPLAGAARGPETIAGLGSAIAIAPGDALLHAKRARLRVEANDDDGAVEDATKAIELAPGLALAWAARGLAHGDRWENGPALEDAGRAVALDSGLALAWAARSVAKARAEDAAGAMADAGKALELEPGLPWALSARASARCASQDWKGALKDATEATARAPGTSFHWRILRTVFMGMRDWARALPVLGRCLELAPGNVGVLQDRIACNLELGALDAAIADARTWIAVSPGDVGARLALISALVKKGAFPAALQADREAARAFPRDLDVRLQEVSLLTEATRFEDAFFAADDAVALVPTSAAALGARASARLRRDRPDLLAAERDYTEAIARAPGTGSFFHGRSRARLLREDLKGALEDADRAIELEPDEPEAWMARCRVRLEAGDHERALDDVDKALSLDASNSIVHALRGDVLLAGQRWESAAADASKAIELDPGYPEPWRVRGTARDKLGDRAGAISDLDHYVETAGNDDRAAAAKARLAELRRAP